MQKPISQNLTSQIPTSPARLAATITLTTLLWGMSAGCFFSRSQSNPVLDPATVAQIVPGTSTAADVTGLLGAPNEVVQLGRRSAWRYEHLVEKQSALFLLILGLRGVDIQADRVWVFFDEQDNVTNVGTMFQANEAKYDIPGF